jgi:hypothetical protein
MQDSVLIGNGCAAIACQEKLLTKVTRMDKWNFISINHVVVRLLVFFYLFPGSLSSLLPSEKACNVFFFLFFGNSL